MRKTKRMLLLAFLCVLMATSIFAQGGAESSEPKAWPSDTVTIVVNAQAGSGSDLLARIIGNYLQKTTGKAFVVKNDTTGNSTIAYETVANAKKDGLTIGFFNNHFLQYHGGVYKKNPWDIFDLVGIGPYGKEGFVLVGHPKAEYQTIQELIAYAKANPGKLVSGIQNCSPKGIFSFSH